MLKERSFKYPDQPSEKKPRKPTKKDLLLAGALTTAGIVGEPAAASAHHHHRNRIHHAVHHHGTPLPPLEPLRTVVVPVHIVEEHQIGDGLLRESQTDPWNARDEEALASLDQRMQDAYSSRMNIALSMEAEEMDTAADLLHRRTLHLIRTTRERLHQPSFLTLDFMVHDNGDRTTEDRFETTGSLIHADADELITSLRNLRPNQALVAHHTGLYYEVAFDRNQRGIRGQLAILQAPSAWERAMDFQTSGDQIDQAQFQIEAVQTIGRIAEHREGTSIGHTPGEAVAFALRNMIVPQDTALRDERYATDGRRVMHVRTAVDEAVPLTNLHVIRLRQLNDGNWEAAISGDTWIERTPER